LSLLSLLLPSSRDPLRQFSQASPAWALGTPSLKIGRDVTSCTSGGSLIRGLFPTPSRAFGRPNLNWLPVIFPEVLRSFPFSAVFSFNTPSVRFADCRSSPPDKTPARSPCFPLFYWSRFSRPPFVPPSFPLLPSAPNSASLQNGLE